MSTRSGWLDKVEVVEVVYDSATVSYDELTRLAKKNSCASQAFPMTDGEAKIARKHYGDNVAPFAGKVRVVKDTKYYLKNSPLQYVPMTEAQASRVNGNVAQGQTWLSPGQRRLFAVISKHKKGWKSAVGQPLTTAWEAASQRAAKLQASE
ncbi:MAG: hypothetical protein AAF581_00735 [Planctomycetota bacterium]